MNRLSTVVFWLLFALNALYSPFMLLMGLKAWAFNVREELSWSVAFGLGIVVALVFATKGMRLAALLAIVGTSLLSIYVLARVSG